MIGVGDRLPEATMLVMGAEGPQGVALGERLAGRKVALFGIPGAFTGTCTTAHVPSFIRAMDALTAKGVDEVICVSVNDPFVMAEFGKATGAAEAGIAMLADADGSFAKAIGRDLTVPAAGFFGRSMRYAMVVEDGVVRVINEGDAPGSCNMSAGDTLAESI